MKKYSGQITTKYIEQKLFFFLIHWPKLKHLFSWPKVFLMIPSYTMTCQWTSYLHFQWQVLVLIKQHKTNYFGHLSLNKNYNQFILQFKLLMEFHLKITFYKPQENLLYNGIVNIQRHSTNINPIISMKNINYHSGSMYNISINIQQQQVMLLEYIQKILSHMALLVLDHLS